MRRLPVRLTAVVTLFAVVGVAALAAPPSGTASAPAASAEALEARTQQLAAQLRCLVCQNQTIADSHAPLALDLKQQVRLQLEQGRSEAEILQYMTERYGDFVLYNPPLKGSTALLWAAPALLMALALGGLALALRRRARQPDTAFEPDPEADDASAAD
ncbi:cytochrome c-type biogenesis protein [Inhella gelatinilytica]|uniref:Cytochrome c-type biogenesis protein n=1 Tax=Inhella gelatinilytica TaxID=2795030 RepID=A0A931IY95_9BURK|nr:cytochrome c-type biogenesis protein [Inhella gelatinilytica]MBH9552046.1 cytochrome c-type biogenesis protein CcmH [Inhella gelatinilytica]